MTAPRVLVTGGGRGIGRAIALRFAREGAYVSVAARSSDQLDEVAREIEAAGGKALAAQMDVCDHGSVEAAVYRTLEFTDGALDVLVNNAGLFAVKAFDDLDIPTWRALMETNLTGPYYVTMEALDGLEASDGAHVFNIASVAAKQGFEKAVAYCTTKWGLRGFSEALRLDLAPKGMRVSTVYPGATDTTIFDSIEGDWDRSTMNQPEDVAEVVWKAWSAGPDEDVNDLDVPPPA